MSARLEVAVGVVLDAHGAVLLGQRVAGKAYAGWWEFPGGKIEAGEDPATALARELDEELGLAVRGSHPWLLREFTYPHAHVRLHFRRLFAGWADWSGEPHGREGQAFAWQSGVRPLVEPLLPASLPLFPCLRLPACILPWHPGMPLDADARPDERTLLKEAGLEGLLAATVPLRLLDAPWRSDPAFEAEVARAAALLRERGGCLLVPSSGRIGGPVDGLILEGPELHRLASRPPVRLCAARCADAADALRAAELGLDFTIAPQPDPGTALPVYVEAAGRAADLAGAIRAGAHGLAAPAAAIPGGLPRR